MTVSNLKLNLKIELLKKMYIWEVPYSLKWVQVFKTEKGQFRLLQIQSKRNPVKHFIAIKQIVCNYKRINLVWCLWLIMKENCVILILKVFGGRKWIIEGSV